MEDSISLCTTGIVPPSAVGITSLPFEIVTIIVSFLPKPGYTSWIRNCAVQPKTRLLSPVSTISPLFQAAIEALLFSDLHIQSTELDDFERIVASAPNRRAALCRIHYIIVFPEITVWTDGTLRYDSEETRMTNKAAAPRALEQLFTILNAWGAPDGDGITLDLFDLISPNDPAFYDRRKRTYYYRPALLKMDVQGMKCPWPRCIKTLVNTTKRGIGQRHVCTADTFALACELPCLQVFRHGDGWVKPDRERLPAVYRHAQRLLTTSIKHINFGFFIPEKLHGRIARLSQNMVTVRLAGNFDIDILPDNDATWPVLRILVIKLEFHRNRDNSFFVSPDGSGHYIPNNALLVPFCARWAEHVGRMPRLRFTRLMWSTTDHNFLLNFSVSAWSTLTVGSGFMGWQGLGRVAALLANSCAERRWCYVGSQYLSAPPPDDDDENDKKYGYIG